MGYLWDTKTDRLTARLLWCRWPIDDLPTISMVVFQSYVNVHRRAQEVEGAVILCDIGQNSSGIMDQSLSRPSNLLGYPHDPYHIMVNPLRKTGPVYPTRWFQILKLLHVRPSKWGDIQPFIIHSLLQTSASKATKQTWMAQSSSMMYRNIYLPSRWWFPKMFCNIYRNTLW